MSGWLVVLVYVAGPVVAGVAAGIAVDAALTMREMRLAGEHLAATPGPVGG